jgi:pSer/pThr/pTyr-binding forkhead associated (FHA) protein
MWLVASASVAGNLPFRIDDGEFVIGRSKRAQVILVDPTVSRRHAKLIRNRHEVTLEDLGSSNATFVNGRRIERCNVQVGDQVRIGGVNCAISSSPLKFLAHGEDESTFQIRREHGDTAQIETFTPAQKEIIKKVMEGQGEAEIAASLGKNQHTIHAHLMAIFKRVGVHSRAELIVKLTKRE